MRDEALRNKEALCGNKYPGRGIVVGLDPFGEYLVQVYWIMGRSAGSRNRLFNYDLSTGQVFTETADPEQAKGAMPRELGIYNAMLELPEKGLFAVSNGNQTDAILDSDGDLRKSLLGWQYEPDPPINTPRIAARCGIPAYQRPFVELAILRRAETTDDCEKAFWRFDRLTPGYGYCITTYAGDGNPPPAFRGEPYVLPIDDFSSWTVAQRFAALLNADNLVAVAVKFTDLGTRRSSIGVVNKYERKWAAGAS